MFIEPRTKNPTIWVSHQSAAVFLGLGVFIPPAHQFISTERKQLRSDTVHVRVRSEGLDPDQWIVRDGMATTSPVQTLIDLDAANTDGSHLGRFLRDALDTGQSATRNYREPHCARPLTHCSTWPVKARVDDSLPSLCHSESLA